MTTLKVKKLAQDAILPQRQTPGSAGYDLCSYNDYELRTNPSRVLVETKLAITVPEGTYGRIAPRSGLSCKHIHVGAGVIDRDYTGEVKVLLYNLNDTTYNIKKGDRIAQLILEKIETTQVEEVDELSSSDRGAGGFGSTGS